MDNSVVTALAALAGAAIGGTMTVFASWLSQHAQARMQWIAQNRSLRQDLYREFINQSSKLYIHALQNSNADVVALMGLYAELSRMRIMSSETVVNRADLILKKIIYSYLEPNKTFPELRQMANSGLIDPLRDFSEACREEFRLRNSPFDR
jgi:ABC-type multidrug transport system fused ATPase/permease subunit